MQETGLSAYISNPTTIYADNKQANTLTAEDLVTTGNMYFRTGYHYCKEAVRDKFCTIEYIDTAYNISDSMTKALGSNKIRHFRPYIMGHKLLPSDMSVIAGNM